MCQVYFLGIKVINKTLKNAYLQVAYNLVEGDRQKRNKKNRCS